jgi:hypothetical protein
MMLEEFRYILSELNVGQDPTWGAFVELIDFEHRDYIEDVFIEIFDVEYSFSTNEDASGKYILYFEENASYESANSPRTDCGFRRTQGCDMPIYAQ